MIFSRFSTTSALLILALAVTACNRPKGRMPARRLDLLNASAKANVQPPQVPNLHKATECPKDIEGKWAIKGDTGSKPAFNVSRDPSGKLILSILKDGGPVENHIVDGSFHSETSGAQYVAYCTANQLHFDLTVGQTRIVETYSTELWNTGHISHAEILKPGAQPTNSSTYATEKLMGQ